MNVRLYTWQRMSAAVMVPLLLVHLKRAGGKSSRQESPHKKTA